MSSKMQVYKEKLKGTNMNTVKQGVTQGMVAIKERVPEQLPTPTIPRWVMWSAFVWGWISWLVALAGISAVQWACGKYGYNRFGAGAGNFPGPGPRVCPTTDFLSCTPACDAFGNGQQYCLFYDGGASCDKFFRYQWWQVWYQFFVLTFLMVLLFTNFLRFSRGALLAFVTIATLFMMDFTNTFGALMVTAGVENSPGSGNQRVQVCYAGGIMLSLANFFLLFVFGLGDVEGEQSWALEQEQRSAAQGEDGLTPLPESYSPPTVEETTAEDSPGKMKAEEVAQPPTPFV